MGGVGFLFVVVEVFVVVPTAQTRLPRSLYFLGKHSLEVNGLEGGMLLDLRKSFASQSSLQIHLEEALQQVSNVWVHFRELEVSLQYFSVYCKGILVEKRGMSNNEFENEHSEGPNIDAGSVSALIVDQFRGQVLRSPTNGHCSFSVR